MGSPSPIFISTRVASRAVGETDGDFDLHVGGVREKKGKMGETIFLDTELRGIERQQISFTECSGGSGADASNDLNPGFQTVMFWWIAEIVDGSEIKAPTPSVFFFFPRSKEKTEKGPIYYP